MNKTLFSTRSTHTDTDTKNAAGGKAYSLSDKQALAQLACTNTFNSTFYASAKASLDETKEIVNRLLVSDPVFVAKMAFYSRHHGYMKDMPAYLCVALATLEDKSLFHKTFDHVVDNGKMLRNVVQIARHSKRNMSSGCYRSALNRWFKKPPHYIFGAIIGNDPTLKDILSMSHPKPLTPEHNALFDYIRNGYKKNAECLPEIVEHFEAFKRGEAETVPRVDFRLLDGLPLTTAQWTEIALKATWNQAKKNLNTYQRHGVFADEVVVEEIARKISSKEEVLKSKVFPYEIMVAYLNTGEVPQLIRLALQDAMEHATENTPKYDGQVHIGVDVSGSMSSVVTDQKTSTIRYIDVAALFACTVLRKNQNATILPFDTSVHKSTLNPRDSIMTNARTLATYGGGGTDCSLPLRRLNEVKACGDVIIISDNESWYQLRNTRSTGLMAEWLSYKSRNKSVKLVLIDISPQITSQAIDHKDILRVGGFSDSVFDVIDGFLKENSKDYWVKEIESIEL